MKKIIKYKEHEIIITVQDNAVTFINNELENTTAFITSITLIIQIKGKDTLLHTVKNIMRVKDLKEHIIEGEKMAINYIDNSMIIRKELEKLYQELEFIKEEKYVK